MDDIVGKEYLKALLDEGGSEKVISQTVNNPIAEGDIVIGDGTIVSERNDKIETSHFADVYTLQDGKIKKLISYMVMDKSDDK